MRRVKIYWIAIALAAAPVLLLLNPGLWDISIKSTRYDLEVIGASIYEFHAQTGHWPAQPDDLGRTSLPLRLRYWRVLLQQGNIVVVWPDKLSADPRQNSSAILAYHNQGLIEAFGSKWVCRGDLRTEYISNASLKRALAGH
jgi:hypothetical protein